MHVCSKGHIVEEKGNVVEEVDRRGRSLETWVSGPEQLAVDKKGEKESENKLGQGAVAKSSLAVRNELEKAVK